MHGEGRRPAFDEVAALVERLPHLEVEVPDRFGDQTRDQTLWPLVASAGAVAGSGEADAVSQDCRDIVGIIERAAFQGRVQQLRNSMAGRLGPAQVRREWPERI